MKFEKNHLYFIPLGGSGEIGMNLNLYGINDEWLMVDLGVTFSQELGLEVVMPNPQFITERRKQLKGILLTHAHEDHLGALPYLWPQLRCPVYGTRFTLEILKGKLRDAGLDGEVELIEIPLSGRAQIGPFDVELVTLTHSIPEPNGVMIRTAGGNIFHTGDWKIDPEPLVGEQTDFEKIAKLSQEGITAMVCDSTNAPLKGRSGSEGAVEEALSQVIAGIQSGQIIVTCFASNVARLQSVIKAAHLHGRKVLPLGRSIHRMLDAAKACGYLKDLPRLLTPEQFKSIPLHERLVVCTGSQGEARAALARLAHGQNSDVQLCADDTVIFSSRVIPGNEKLIGKIKNEIISKGVRIIAWEHENIHVSGHPYQEELKEMYAAMKPMYAIPVHGELYHMAFHAKLAKEMGVKGSIIPRNGDVISISADGLKKVSEVTHGRLVMDGKSLISLDHPALRERRKGSYEGYVFVSVFVDEDGALAAVPQVAFQGLVGLGSLQEDVQLLVEDTFEALPEPMRFDSVSVGEHIRIAIRKYIHNKTDKKPLTTVHVGYNR